MMQSGVVSPSVSRAAKKNFWLPLVKQWQERKESPKTFSKRLNLNLDQFNYWRRKLSSAPAISSKLIKLEIEPAHMMCKSFVQIELPSGIKIRLQGNIDGTQLKQIFSLLGVVHD